MDKSERLALTGIVLAGGQSRRMGRNKALMELQGQPLIGRVLEQLAQLCDELIISANEVDVYAGLSAQVVTDLLIGRGPLSGIHAGLTAMRNQRAIVVACDMPFLNLPLLRYLASAAPDCDVVVPRLGDDYEPLHAVYSAVCAEAIERLVAAGPRRVVHLYDSVRVHVVKEDTLRSFDPHLRSLVNVNTPEEWARIQQIVI